MKKIEKRAFFCLLLSAILLVGLAVFCFRFVTRGSSWAAFPANRHLYTSTGQLANGRILDRYGQVLLETQGSQRVYTLDQTGRRATLHAVGDSAGNIGTGAQTAFASKLSGYNLVTGAQSVTGSAGNDLYLTIDASLNQTAYNALNGRNGTVGVYNYETGEILCMVSAPAFDPANPPSAEDIESNSAYQGVYLNRLLSATFTPGSVFKVVTLHAATEQIPDLYERTFVCDGSLEIGGQTITCPSVHGTMDIAGAFAKSCNCAFGQLASELGAANMQKYTSAAGLDKRFSVSGMNTAAGSFSFPAGDPGNLAWSGIGQHNDLVNPAAFMVYMGAIGRGGTPVMPQLISQTQSPIGLPLSLYIKNQGSRMMSEETANAVSDIMRGAVVNNYGDDRFPGMQACAKSGTAEVGEGKSPHSWFAGFLRDEEHPYAFVVMVENGGGGNTVAGAIASTVLKAACS